MAVTFLLSLSLLCDFFIAKLTIPLFSLLSTDMHTMFINTWFRAFIKGFQNSVTLVSIAVGIKLAKYWYLKQQENNRLTTLKIYNEKQVLKANIRPDFLLYALDNLRRKIAVSYRDSAEMILHLSEVFSYILYDCSEELIPLGKEIAAVENLITVEKIIHNNKVGIDFSTNITVESKLVPPLLIFSFVQKIFGEGELKSKKFNNISIQIYTLHDELCLTCKLNYSDKIVIDFIPIEELNENEKKLYALFNRFDITRNEHENNYVINLATFLHEPEKVKA
jgi:LytS/YehU family sensor histidine kinase